MAKIKTKKALSKRIKITSSEKMKRHKAGKSHLLRKKSSKRKRKLRKAGLIKSARNRKGIRRLLPNR